MKIGSLFSGIGGLDLGLERAGMEVRWQVENDDFCRRVLAKHWPNVPCYGDIRELDGRDLEPVDLICGGFPCQPTSHAGRRRGEADDRWLWPEMLRLVREVKPAYVVGENVFGLVTHNEGLLLASIVADLEAEGYEVAPPIVFPACAVGALHRRDRVWICAHARHHWRGATQEQKQKARPRFLAGVCTTDSYSDQARWPHAQGCTRQVACTGIGAIPEPAHAQRGLGFWTAEPGMDRVVDGLSGAVDRLRALGNAVVPQAAELIGRMIQSPSLLQNRGEG